MGYETIDGWDAKRGSLLTELRGHQAVDDAMFSPEGTRILTRDRSSRIRVWDLEGSELVSLQLDGLPFQSTWSPDGTSILVGKGNAAHLCRSTPWPELAQLGEECTPLDDRIRLRHEERKDQ